MTSENLKTRDFAKEYSEFKKVLFSRNPNPANHLFCGSFFELPLLYILSNPTDIDIMYCDMAVCAIFDQVNSPEKEGNVLKIDSTNCHLGYVRLKNQANYFRKPYDFNTGPAHTRNLSVPFRLSSFLGKIFIKWEDLNVVSRDTVYAIPCPSWPPDAYEWKTRKRLNGWPKRN